MKKRHILLKQQILFSKLSIQSVINEDGTIITTDSNISESTFKKLSFVTNNPAYNPVPMNLIGISVFLNEKPLHVNGFFEYCRKRIDASDKMAFSLGKEVHSPMLDASVVDQLLGYQVHGMKTFQLVLDPNVVRRPPKVTGSRDIKVRGFRGLPPIYNIR